MLKKSLFNILFIFFLFILLSSYAYATVRVEPARIIINSKQDSRSTGVIEVVNNGDEQVLLQAYLFDWTLNDNDGLVTFEPGYLETTLNNLIKFNPRSFILDPGQKQIVRFTINTPSDLDRELRGVVFFERETNLIDESSGARVVTQLGTVIYLIPDNVNYNFKLNEVKFANQDVTRCLLVMENQGRAHLRFKIDYKVIDSNSNLVEESTLFNNVLLPEFERSLVLTFKEKLEPGDYKLILDYTFLNTNKTANYEIPFGIK